MRALIFLMIIMIGLGLGWAAVTAVYALTANRKPKKIERNASKLLNQIEEQCMNAVQVDQYDLTANQVLNLIRKNRLKELS